MKAAFPGNGIHQIPGVDCPADLSGYSSRDINQQTTCETLGTKERRRDTSDNDHTWTSPELNIVLLQRVTSPQTGETIIRIAKISRGKARPRAPSCSGRLQSPRPGRTFTPRKSGSRSDTGPRHSQKGRAGGIGTKSGGLENCSASRTKVPRNLSARFLSTPNANIAAYARITESRNA